MRLSIDCRLRYEVRTPTSFILAIQAADGADQTVDDETILLPPGVAADFFVDAFAGNRFVRFVAQPGPLDIVYTAQVDRRGIVDQRGFIGGAVINDLPVSVLPYLNPSRYCPSDRLTPFARQTFGARPQGLGQVQAIADWIAASITYQAGVSSDVTSAIDTLVDRAGVCRDFAHIGVALCRALDIPARFVSCYAFDLSPPDFHAVFQVYLDGAWRTFDATRRAPLAGLVPIGFGRDAADVPFAASFGDARFEAKSILVTRVDNTPAS
ncbi:transglutaminase-like domain-containing protein [Caulobacter hibisci]|uniref:Transglutaminase family protein n=1 Tax=Caulobacter hibisci TaxID=2035993 RepID=A0ABS0SRK7_9CAUL|nr:transglutaminase family protein [Caulobacter hibisci]MBI1682089.1 transglutaminase family protein [Caulobacter hibisci]